MHGRMMRATIGGGCLLLTTAVAQAQPYGSGYATPYGYGSDRAGRWEASIGMRYQDYGSFDFRGPSALDVGSSVGFGFTIGYNFDQYFSLALELAGDSADYDGTFYTDDAPSEQVAVSGELDTSTGQLLATWHFLPGKFTPFINVGIGWSYIDTNIISSYAGTGCWYNPWWGYSCSDYYNTYDDTMLSWSTAVGLRWDITPVVFLRGSVGKQWLDLDGIDTADTTIGRLEIGMTF
jgi:hypothetical protein